MESARLPRLSLVFFTLHSAVRCSMCQVSTVQWILSSAGVNFTSCHLRLTCSPAGLDGINASTRRRRQWPEQLSLQISTQLTQLESRWIRCRRQLRSCSSRNTHLWRRFPCASLRRQLLVHRTRPRLAVRHIVNCQLSMELSRIVERMNI